MYAGQYSPYDQTYIGQGITTGYVTANTFEVPQYATTWTTSLPTIAPKPPKEWRRNVVHAPPPVELAMCTKPIPMPLPMRSRPHGVAWLASVHGGQRERRAIRSRVERKDAA